MSLPRRHQAAIISDLKQKMVLVGGPRQVGKTTMAKQILEASGGGSTSPGIAGRIGTPSGRRAGQRN
jgi:hypothetical protein